MPYESAMLHEELCLYERQRREFFLIAPWSEDAEPPDHPLDPEGQATARVSGEPTMLPGETPKQAAQKRRSWENAKRFAESKKHLFGIR